jgi:hypothetical protein
MSLVKAACSLVCLAGPVDVGWVQGLLRVRRGGNIGGRRSRPMMREQEATDVGLAREFGILASLEDVNAIEGINKAELFEGFFGFLGEAKFQANVFYHGGCR